MGDKKRGRRRSSSRRGLFRRASLARVSLFCLAATLILAPQLIGGAFGWSIAIVAVLSVLSLLAALGAASPGERDRVPLLFWLFAAGFAATALQVVPLPCGVVEWLAPRSVALSTEAFSLLGMARDRCRLTLDPGGTLTELVRWSALSCCALASYWLSLRDERTAVLRAVAASGVVLALVSLAHQVVDAEAIFGLYRPRHAQASYGPLVNTNHLAGLMALTSPVAWGLAVGERALVWRVTWLMLAVLMAVTLFSSWSMGGITVYVGAAVGFVVLLRKRRIEARSIPWRSFLPVAAIVCMALGTALVLRRAAPTSEMAAHKIDFVQSTTRVLRETPLFGLGRGAFRAGFSELNPTTSSAEYPENILVHWTSEWGLLVGAALLALLGVIVVRGARGSSNPASLGAAVGVTAVLVQNLVDFSLEMTPVACVWAACMGALAAWPVPVESAEERPRSWWLGRTLTAASVGAVLIFAPHLHALDRTTLADALVDRTKAGRQRAAMEDAVAMHPADPGLTLLSASAAVALHTPNAMKFVERAERRAPTWSAPALLAAQLWVARGQPSEAAKSVRRAAELEMGSSHPTACVILARWPSIQLALAMAPADRRQTEFLDILTRCPAVNPELASVIDYAILELDPTDLRALPRVSLREASHGDVALAEQRLRNGLARHRGDPGLTAALVELLTASGRPQAALELCAKQPEHAFNLRLLRAKAGAEAALGDASALRATLAELRAATPTNARDQAGALMHAGNLELRAGNQAAALRAYEEANNLLPSAQALKQIGIVSQQLGMLDRAQLAFDRALELDPNDAQTKAARNRVSAQRSSPNGAAMNGP